LNRCKDRVAVVTGASRGIGRALTVRLAAEGATVVAVSRSTSSSDYGGSLLDTVRLAADVGGRAVPVGADVGTAEGRERIQRAAEELDRPVAIVVNNAAADREFAVGFADMTEAAFQQALNVNVWGAWDLAARFVPAMRSQGEGWVLNVSSAQAAPRIPGTTRGTGGACLYGGTKAMLDRITTGAAMELYGDNIAVNALAPEAAVLTEHSSDIVRHLGPSVIEPVETFVEAALALVSTTPRRLTGRVAYSLSLVKELDLPVLSLDGRELLAGWQPAEIDEKRLFGGYLR
jgi:NAD(P)-dependent dehydrogenase (short-subunit alcohol dehydrogenase family)